MKHRMKLIEVEESSGNVFADLNHPNPEDAFAKAKLAARICQVINDRGLTQAKAAKMLGLDQPKISALVRGKLSGFSAERLFRLLNDLGQEVQITIRPVRKPKSRGSVQVLAEIA
jgi:predicted XRE-type DNA-binding protein